MSEELAHRMRVTAGQERRPLETDLKSAQRWVVLAVIVVARTGVGLQFIAVAALLPELRAALGLNYTEIGLLLGLFMATGVVLSLPSGAMTARVGDRRMLQAGLLALVAGALGSALAPSFELVLLARLIGGLGAVLVTVTGANVLAAWFAGREITTAMSFMGVTWPIGIGLGLALLPVLSAMAGWRVAMGLAGVLPALALLSTAILPANDAHKAPSAPSGVSAISGRELKAMFVAALAWPLMSSGGYVVFSSYAPAYLQSQDVPYAQATLAVSLLSWLFVLTIPLGGYLADRFARSDLLFYVGCLASAATIALVPLGGPYMVLVAATAIMGLSVGPIMALPGVLLSPEGRGTGLGVYYAIYYLGTVLFPTMAGWLQDATGSLTAAIWYSVACLLAAPFPLLAVRVLQRRWAQEGA